MNHILEGLNAEQKDAVTTLRGPVLVIAGPGSGKTKTLTHRIAYLIETGVSPRNILAVTFTNKAAGEMKERVRGLTSKNPILKRTSFLDLTISTFHAFGARVIRDEAQALGTTRRFTIYDDTDSLHIMKDVVKDSHLDPAQFDPKRILATISSFKNELLTCDIIRNEAENQYQQALAVLYAEYEERLKKANACDFDDLLMKPVLLFRKNPAVLARYQQRYPHVLVDEFQDSNASEYELVKRIAETHRNIYVVGDMDQAIYGWKGASLKNIFQFEKDFPEHKTVVLEQNYRSTQTILEAANHIITHNKERKPKTLWTENKEGARVTIRETGNEFEEGEFVMKEIRKLLTRGETLREITVLYRTNAQSRAIEETFLRHNFPYTVVGTVRFYERKEIKDILAWLRLIHNASDTASLKRISLFRQKFLPSKKGLKKNAILQELIREFTEKAARMPLTDLIHTVIETTGYEAYLRDGSEQGEMRWENVQELLTVAKRHDQKPPTGALDAFLEEVSLMSQTDLIQDTKNTVHLMTIHAAKGLEFGTIFLIGCEENLLPHARSLISNKELEEERRLCYVAITRAKRNAYLTFAAERKLFGGTQVNAPSRFLLELPPTLIEFQTEGEEVLDINQL